MKVLGMVGDPQTPQCPRSYRASGPGTPPAAAAPAALAPGNPRPGGELYPAGSTATERRGKKKREGPHPRGRLSFRLASLRAALQPFSKA